MITPSDLRNFYLSWKSTLIGLLGLVIALVLAWSTLPPKPGWAVTVLAIGRALLQFMQQDAGATLATVPGSNKIEVVPAHEVPDDPNAVPVTQTTQEK